MNALSKQETAGTQFLAVIAKAASDPTVDVEKMDRLLQIQERVLARQSEADFNAAMASAQAEMGPISADAENPQTRSKYASYAKLDRVLRPIYSKHGFALSFGEADCPKPDYVRVTCLVSHRGGYSREYHRDMPADGKGAKGGDVMTKTHASGAAQSYGMRYLLKGIFNVAVGEGDKDGNAELPTITERQAADLDCLLTETGSDKAQFMKWAKVESLDQILAKNFEYVCKEVRARAKARAGR